MAKVNFVSLLRNEYRNVTSIIGRIERAARRRIRAWWWCTLLPFRYNMFVPRVSPTHADCGWCRGQSRLLIAMRKSAPVGRCRIGTHSPLWTIPSQPATDRQNPVGGRTMQLHPFGSLFPVSTLTLGGGGLGMLWGQTTYDECVATVHAAVAAGINLLDLAPRYGDGMAERVVGEAYGGRLPAGVHITSRCNLGNPPPDQVER